jgi:hypothetical protein
MRGLPVLDFPKSAFDEGLDAPFSGDDVIKEGADIYKADGHDGTLLNL